MINNLFRIALIIGIILLFFGESIASTINENNSEKNLIQNNFVNSAIHNNTVRIFCDEDDHCLYYYNEEGENYSIGHNATFAQGLDPGGDINMGLGQYKDGEEDLFKWRFYRYYTYFNTSIIPDYATITNVKFTFFCSAHIGDEYPDPKLMAFYDPSGIYPSKPLDLSDFNINHYLDTNAGYFIVDWLEQYTWTWDPNSFNCINKNGWTKIMFTTQADWNADESFVKDFLEIRSANYSLDDNPHNESYFDITYNRPPNIPYIDGPIKFKPNENKEFNFSTTDPDGDQIYYYIDWGDETNSGWLGPYISGNQLKLTHSWTERDYFTIKCKAKDIHDVESDWGTLNISTPRGKILNLNLLLLLETHPNLFLILQKHLNKL